MHRLKQKSLTIDTRAPRWPPTPRGLLRLPGPRAPSGPGLLGTETRTSVRGTELASGTTTTRSFPQGKITPEGNYKKAKTCVPKSPRPIENPGVGGHWRTTLLRKAQGIICSAALHEGPCSPHTHVLLSVFPTLKPSYSPAAV